MTGYNLEALAQDNRWEAILPEISLALLALALLILEMLLPAERRRIIPAVAIAGQGFVLLMTISFAYGSSGLTGEHIFNGLLLHSLDGDLFRMFFLLAGIFVTLLGHLYLSRREEPQTEFFHITLVVIASMMLLAQSAHFLMLFVALETVTIGFYVLVGYVRASVFSLEAGLKYLVLGGLSSSLLLFGIVLLYGIAGNPGMPAHTADPMSFANLAAFIAANPEHPVVIAGALLVICGVCFKIGAVPFQIWIPDVYQGAPLPVTGFLAVASKGAGFAVLLALVKGPFAALGDVLVPLLSAVAVVTILFGNLSALTQRNIKRLLGLSGIAHAGYLIMGVAASFAVDWAASAVIFYLFIYLFASFAVIGVVTLVAPAEDALHSLDEYGEFYKHHPFLAGILVIGLGSLAGIPPLAGFIGKVLIFIAAYQAGLTAVLLVALIGVVLSIYYYFGWILSAVLRQPTYPEGAETKPHLTTGPIGTGTRIALISLAAVTILVGFYPGLLGFIIG